MKEIQLDPIESIQDYLIQINRFKELIYLSDSHMLFFRGESNYDWPIEPAVFRYGLLKNEHKIIQEVIRQHPSEFTGFNRFDSLVKMQHYGVPTRLLDVTMNPLIALFFACRSMNNSTDGKIVLITGAPEESTSDCIKIISHYAFSNEFAYSYDDKLLEVWLHNVITKTEINFKRKENDEHIANFQHSLINGYISKNYIVLPSMNSERIKRQNGAFILFGCGSDSLNKKDANNVYKKVSHVLNSSDRSIRYYSILKVNSEHKRKILFDLDSLGINHTYVFPEMESTAKYLIEKYRTNNVEKP